jgi:copper transport protein
MVRAESRRSPLSIPVLVVLFAALLTLLLSARGWSHTHLRSSSPAAGARLAEIPGELRLTFSESVAAALSRIELQGPDGRVVALSSPVQVADSPRVLVVKIEGALVAGEYQVVWQTAGGDGHPVRGRFQFAIEEAAFGAGRMGAGASPAGEGRGQSGSGLAQGRAPETSSGGAPGGASASRSGSAPGADLGAAAGHAAPSDLGGARSFAVESPLNARRFGVESPLYALVRLLVFVGVLGVVGVTAFQLLVLSRVVRTGRVAGRLLAESIGVAPARLGLGFVGLLVVAVALRLIAQGYALGGGRFDGAGLRAMLVGTVWGWGWLVQGTAAVVAGLGFRRASRARLGGWAVAGGAALVLGFTPGLSGHAAGVPARASLALLADAGHVLGAGGWLGTLLVLLGIGLPAALRLEEAVRGAAVAGLVHAFSALALCSASLVIVTGGIGAWLHLGALSALWQSDYGRALMVKLGVLALVFGAGAYNFLRVRPMVESAGGARRLRRTSTLELAVGAVVLVVTAVLVALPAPRLEAPSAGELTTRQGVAGAQIP